MGLKVGLEGKLYRGTAGSTATTEMPAPSIIILGSAEMSKVVRNSASRVALPAMCWAIMSVAASIAAAVISPVSFCDGCKVWP